jgi:hypothetical protein
MLDISRRLRALEDAVERLNGLLNKHLQLSSDGYTHAPHALANARSVPHPEDDTITTDQLTICS